MRSNHKIVYASPKTLGKDEYRKLQDTVKSITSLLQKVGHKSMRIVLLNGDFNTIVKWNSNEALGTENYLNNMVLELMQEFSSVSM